MYEITGLRTERGDREVLATRATSAGVQQWLTKVGKYCSSHSYYIVVSLEFKSENVEPVRKVSTLGRIINGHPPTGIICKPVTRSDARAQSNGA